MVVATTGMGKVTVSEVEWFLLCKFIWTCNNVCRRWTTKERPKYGGQKKKASDLEVASPQEKVCYTHLARALICGAKRKHALVFLCTAWISTYTCSSGAKIVSHSTLPIFQHVQEAVVSFVMLWLFVCHHFCRGLKLSNVLAMHTYLPTQLIVTIIRVQIANISTHKVCFEPKSQKIYLQVIVTLKSDII